MSIASDAPAAHTPSVMRSALLRRKIRGRCVRSSVSSAAGSCGKRRKVSITIRLRRHATSGAGAAASPAAKDRAAATGKFSAEAAMPRTARSGGVSGMLHRTTVRRADLIEGIVDSLVRIGEKARAYLTFQSVRSSDPFGLSVPQPRSAKISVGICFPFTATSPSRRVRYLSFAFASVAPLTITRASYSGVFVNSSRREARLTPSPMTV